MGVLGDPLDRDHGKIAFGVDAGIHLNLLYGMPTVSCSLGLEMFGQVITI